MGGGGAPITPYHPMAPHITPYHPITPHFPPTEASLCRMGRVGGTHGWWGPRAQLLTALEQCEAEDVPPGLHLLTFLRPRNDSQPDKVGGA